MATELVPVANKAAGNFVENESKPAILYVSPFYTSAEPFPGGLKAASVDHRMKSSSVIVQFLNKPRCHTRMTITPMS